MSDRELDRLREHLGSLAGSAGPRDDCAGAEEIWAAVRGESHPGRVRELMDHALGCPLCAETWRLAREVASEAAEPRSKGAGRWWMGIAAAAAAVLLVVLAAPRLGDRGSTEPVFREAAGYVIQSRISPEDPQPRADLVLEWSPGPEGTLYAVEVSTVDFEVIDRARRLVEARHRIPPGALDAVPSGAVLLWRVEAKLADGSTVRSPAFRAAVE